MRLLFLRRPIRDGSLGRLFGGWFVNMEVEGNGRVVFWGGEDLPSFERSGSSG